MARSNYGRAFGAHFCLVEIPVQRWRWGGYEGHHWDTNYDVFRARENYSIWPGTFVEMSLFPLLISWLKSSGNFVLVSNDPAEVDLFLYKKGLCVSQEMLNSPDQISRHASVEVGPVYFCENPSVGDVIRAQNLQASDDYIGFDFYFSSLNSSLIKSHAFLGGGSRYWEECSDQYQIFGSYYMPTSEGESAKLLFMSRSLGNVRLASAYVESAFRGLSDIKVKSESSFLGQEFLDMVDQIFASLPASSPKLES